jgi:hypothetical protein
VGPCDIEPNGAAGLLAPLVWTNDPVLRYHWETRSADLFLDPDHRRHAAMPMTRSEAMFFTAGLVIGAAAGANFPALKEKFGPLLSGALAGAGSAFGESYSEMAKKVAEKVEAVQDAMAEMKQAAATASSTADAAGATTT